MPSEHTFAQHNASRVESYTRWSICNLAIVNGGDAGVGEQTKKAKITVEKPLVLKILGHERKTDCAVLVSHTSASHPLKSGHHPSPVTGTTDRPGDLMAVSKSASKHVVFWSNLCEVGIVVIAHPHKCARSGCTHTYSIIDSRGRIKCGL